MRFLISTEIARGYPDLRIGVLVARGIDNHGVNDALESLKQEKAVGLRHSVSPNTLGHHENIAAWREVFQNFGANPRKYQPTAEALIERVAKGRNLPTISKSVDAYLLVELEFFLPVGGYDLDRIAGDIMLRRSAGKETFVPIGATRLEMTDPEEIVYADSLRVLTRRWNFRDCDHCKITEESTNIVLFTEAPRLTIRTEDLARALERLEEYLLQFCGGKISTFTTNTLAGLEYELQ